MKACKDNKVYAVDASSKSRYQADGFDIYNDDGELIEYGAGKTVPYGDYDKIVKENEKLKKEIEELTMDKEPVSLDGMSVEELKAYAEKNTIDIGKSNSRDGILGKIKEAEKEAE